LGAGILQVPASTFWAITVSSTVIWVAAAALVAVHAVRSTPSHIFWGLAAAVFVLGPLLNWGPKAYRSPRTQKWRYFEFWPVWFFYIPVGVYYLLMGLRHRSLVLPLYANPGILNSGIIGESKAHILSQIPDVFSAKLRFAVFTPGESDLHNRAVQFMEEHQLGFPIILKPDVGQRGSGVVLIHDQIQLGERLRNLSYRAILQEYCSFSEEIGVNYVRLPNEVHGKIVGITRKRFPVLIGDGKSRLCELIEADPRARYLYDLYARKHAARLNEILPADAAYVLARIGNHCQGSIFEDGWDLRSLALEEHLDEIARSIPGFFFGRFDIRFESESTLQNGGRLKIIEINGAAGEATHIYDKKMGIKRAYAILFSQVRTLFEIGAKNRRLYPRLRTSFWSDLLRYQRNRRKHPQTS
jgi:hypothetical protein